MSTERSVPLQELSRALFGQELRLEVMIAIAKSDGLVCLTDLAEGLGIRNASRLQRPLDGLKVANLLVPAEMSGTTRKWLRRTPSKVWDWVLDLEQQTREASNQLPA